jgi:hypothetical protein
LKSMSIAFTSLIIMCAYTLKTIRNTMHYSFDEM